VILFSLEIFSVDKIAFLILGSLLLFGLVSPEEAISGFSNSASITVLCMMILVIALEENGIIYFLAEKVKRFGNLPLYLSIPAFMLTSGAISAFISTTAVVIVFIKIITSLKKSEKLSSSKLLMPISFAGILGGSCTLLGTSTNILVNSIAVNSGVEGFTFFEFSQYGIAFLITGIIIVTILQKLLPKDTDDTLKDTYHLDAYITTLIVLNDGKALEDYSFYNKEGVLVLRIKKNGRVYNYPQGSLELNKGDKIQIRSDYDNFIKFYNEDNFDLIRYNRPGFSAKDEANVDENNELKMAELLILPSSNLINKDLKEIYPYQIRGTVPLALKKHQKLISLYPTYAKRLGSTISAGDKLLVEGTSEELEKLKGMSNIVLLEEKEIPERKENWKKWVVSLIMLMVIFFASSGIFSILKSVVLGVFAVLLFQVTDLQNIYKKVNWQIYFLLAGMIPLGLAMTNSGADDYISNLLVTNLYGESPTIIIATLILFTMLFSGFVSNNATAIIITPIALSLAQSMNLDPKIFLLSVMFGANFSFFTPVGYQTNALVYGLGIYRFRDFLIIGGILSLVLWLLATFLLTQ